MLSLDALDHLVAYRREAAAFAAAWPDKPDALVASCPPWTALDLAAHLGQRFGFWGAQVTAADPDHVADVPDAPEQVTTEWFDAQADRLRDTLEVADPERPCWNWSGSNLTAGWVIRRMAHETAVHRWDVEDATGTPNCIETTLAADGIDERIDVFAIAPGGVDMSGAPVMLLVATDVDSRWTISVTSDGVGRASSGRPVLRVDGPASTLGLLLWDRLGLDAVALTSTGDVQLLDAWRAATRFP